MILENLDLVTVDFETYYDQDYQLKKLTTEAYIRDPRFQVIGVGLKKDSHPTEWHSEAAFRVRASEIDWSRTAVLAHHAHFDGLVLSHHFGIRPALWLCTLSMGRALHGTEVGGSLSALMRHYAVGEKGTAVHDHKGRRLEYFLPEEWNSYGEYCRTDTQGSYDIFWRMMEDGFPEKELLVIDRTIRMFTEPSFVLDEAKMKAYLQEEKDRKLDLLKRIISSTLPPPPDPADQIIEGMFSWIDVGGETHHGPAPVPSEEAKVDPAPLSEEELLVQARASVMSNDKLAGLLLDLGVEPPTKVSPKTGKTAFAFAKTDQGFKALLESDVEEVRWLAEARLGVKTTINESRTERFLACGAGGRSMPVYLKYAGAHTGRWSGGDKMNWQNLQRGGMIRKAIRAPEGKLIVAVDSAQIEARKLAWFAGHTKLVDAFAQNRDIYSEFATKTYGYAVSKANVTERFVGKWSILGCGYGLGWEKYAGSMLTAGVQFKQKDADALHVSTADFLSNPATAKRVRAIPSRLTPEALATHCAVSKAFVDAYRRENQPIKDTWTKCDRVLQLMLDREFCKFGPDNILEIVEDGILLPSGRLLHYPDLKWSIDGGFHYRARTRKGIYGGKLTENIIQALARDVIAEQLLAISDRYHVATTTHDEIVCVVDEKEADAALDFMLSVMKTAPAWAKGLPLSAEGGIGESYGEAK